MGGEWPWEAWVAVGGLVLTHFLRPLMSLFRESGENELKIHERGWLRASELEVEVRLLRQALQRSQGYRNAHATISEILVLAMPMGIDERLAAVKQARQIAERSLPDGGGGSEP